MNVTILSSFRNAIGYIDRYFDQVEALQSALWRGGDQLNLVAAYGDSQDGTGEYLFERACYNVDSLLVEVNHGGKHYGSIVHEERFKQLEKVGNALLGHIPAHATLAMILESDLIWDVETMLELLWLGSHNPRGVFAPLVFHQDPPDRFYDTFAFRANGVQFTNDPPYHAILPPPNTNISDKLIEVESAGSCLVMPVDLARRVTVPREDVIVGTCKQLRERGATIYIAPHRIIRHP